MAKGNKKRPKTTLKRIIMNKIKPTNIKILDLQLLASD
jgi:hypothetical protein